ncbi:hypothetical protein [Streptomyces iconiensis]|uniref:Uncharacterized protein n=1 Tax=Streptomyces iconiensis TaxID=1384038 RepID=A0ABT6ZNC8_9ACTN|nr:hypothetical protein [Streptomyces iconiensis]MDJ1130563.1 hypothetical protein [Streptomyces iconiensis]
MRKRLSATAAVLAAALLAVGSGSAVAADPPKAIAPYAQAAASVAKNGDVLAAKNVDEVTNPSTGRYCVHISDPDIDLARSIPTGTLNGHEAKGGSVRVYTKPVGVCNNAPDTAYVSVFNKDGQFANAAFFFTIQ